jgi:hypothetical protein
MDVTANLHDDQLQKPAYDVIDVFLYNLSFFPPLPPQPA